MFKMNDIVNVVCCALNIYIVLTHLFMEMDQIDWTLRIKCPFHVGISNKLNF